MFRLTGRFAALCLAALFVPACDDEESASDSGVSEEACVPSNYIAWCEDALPAAVEVEAKTFFPMPAAGETAAWRFRQQEEDFLNPPEATVASEMTVVQENGAYVRKITAVLDLNLNGEKVRALQVWKELYEKVEGHGLVGPAINLKGVELTETELDGAKRNIRHIVRTYEPAFAVLSDVWHVGEYDNSLEYSDVTLIQDLQNGDEEPVHTEATVSSLKVEISSKGLTLPMEGEYREGVRRVDFFDDFSGQKTRSIWYQAGVGPVQWSSRESNNMTFTLLDTNVKTK